MDTTAKKATGSAGLPKQSFLERIWRFFSSVQLAFVLMLIIIALSLLGALIIQVPGDIAADPQEYAWWLENVAGAKYGAWAPLLALFNLHGIFHSFLFLAAGAFLMVNILICSLNRWKNVRRVMSGGPVKLPDDFYSGSTNRAQLSNLAEAPADAIGKSMAILKRHSYRVRTESIQGKVYLSADKNRLYRLGTYLSHLSLILFILAYIIGSYFGFRDTNFAVAEGATREVGNGTGLSLLLESFTDEYYPDGSPSDFRSDVILFKDGREVQRGTLRVNHPMSYEGTRFFQSFFGTAEVVQVRDSTGKMVYDGAVALTGSFDSGAVRRYTGSFVLPEVGMKVQLISPAVNAPDPMIKKGQLAVQLYHPGSDQVIAMNVVELSTPRTIGGYEFIFIKDAQFSGFQVSKDPGNALVWIASTLFLIGIGMVMYFPYRQVWALCQPESGSGSRLNIRSTSTRGPGAASELKRLVSAIENELSVKKKN